ncbi:MAG: 16S rRNA (uracil(1498)-N(3))-methyltransferase, partial [Prevotella sp.]|nr:16S rRNA (uracil(1498)-N(3))-methyltransferase [Prevotella sp.]
MKEEHFFYVPDAVTAQQLSVEEAKHAARVLRLKEGDPLFLTDGVGNFYHAVVTEASNKHCRYSIQEVLPQQPIWQGH